MDKYTQLEKRILDLEKQIQSLNQSSTISYQVENAFKGRGFLTNSSFVTGYGTCNVGGEYTLVIPGATSQSIVMVTPVTSSTGTLLESTIRASVSTPGQYEIYVQGTATDAFSYIVFLSSNHYTDL